MRQGEVAPQGKWTGDLSGGVKAPPALILPDPATRFARSAARLEALAAGHPMAEWLALHGAAGAGPARRRDDAATVPRACSGSPSSRRWRRACRRSPRRGIAATRRGARG